MRKAVNLISSFVLLIVLGLALGMPLKVAYAVDGCSDNDPTTKCNVLDPVCQTDPDATLCTDNNTPQDTNNNSIYGPNGILGKTVKLLGILVGVVSVIMVIVGGTKYILSNGDSAKVESAKNTILYAIIGLFVAAIAQAAIVFFVNKL